MPNILESIGGALTAPFKGVLDIVGSVINHVTVDPNQRAQVQLALAKLESDHDLAVMDAQTQLQNAQRDVIVAEAKSDSWITRSWRPIVVLSFAAIIVYTFFVGPMFGLKVVAIPDDLWFVLKVSIGGYIGGRTVEKITPTITQAVTQVVSSGKGGNK